MKTRTAVVHLCRPKGILPVVLACLAASPLGCGTEPDGEIDNPPLERASSALNVAQFHGWEEIPNGTFKSGPAISAQGSSAELVCGQGLDNRIFCNFWSTLSGWTGWGAMGDNTFAMRPGVAYYNDSKDQQTAIVAVTAAGNAMFNASVTVGTQQQRLGWRNLPAGQFVQPVAIVAQGGALHVFGVKADQRMYYTSNFIYGDLGQSPWSDWKEVPGGGLFNSAPSATALGNRWLSVAALGTDNRVWITNGTVVPLLNGWHQLAGSQQLLAPGLASRGTTVDVFGAFGTDLLSHVATVDPSVASTPTFDAVPDGLFRSPCAAVARSSTTLDVVGRGLNNSFFIDRWF